MSKWIFFAGLNPIQTCPSSSFRPSQTTVYRTENWIRSVHCVETEDLEV